MEDVITPAELPVEMNSFKSQQFRWAKGSIQTCIKLLPQLLSADLPFRVKAEAFFHLSANFNYLLMVALCVLMFPSMYVRYNMGWSEMLLIDIPMFFAATFSVVNFYAFCQMQAYPQDWKTRLKYLPLLMAVGIGLSVNNTRAVLEAILGKQSEFVRTPKHGVERNGDDWIGKKYHQLMIWQPLLELALGPLLHRHRVLRARQRHLRHPAVPRAVPGRLPVHGRHVPAPAVRRRRGRAQHADRRRVTQSGQGTAKKSEGCKGRATVLDTQGRRERSRPRRILLPCLFGCLATCPCGPCHLVSSTAPCDILTPP